MTLRFASVRSLAVSVVVVASACRFDASLPPSANVVCSVNADCPRGFGCRQPAGQCEAAFTNDQQPPTIARVVITYRNDTVPGVTALGLSGVADVVLEPDEPLSQEPALESDDGVSCSRPNWTSTGLVFNCTVDAGVTQGSHVLSARLFDLAGLGTRVALSEQLLVDTEPPAPVPSPLTVLSTPFSQPPFTGIELDGSQLDGNRVLATVDVLPVLLTPSLDAGVHRLALEPRAGLEVFAVDHAGNRSTPTRVTTVRESLSGPFSPHRAFVVGRLGPALTSGRDWFEADSVGERQRTIPAVNASAWVHHRFEVPASADVTFVAAVDEGHVRVVSGSGAPEVWHYGSGGFERVEGLTSQVGLPPPVRGAAFGYDRASQRLMRIGGEPTGGISIGQDWALTSSQWQRVALIADGGVVDAMLEWSTEGLMLVGGTMLPGRSPILDARLIKGSRFVDTNYRLPHPLTRAVTAFDTPTRSTYLFGGVFDDGGLSDELIRFQSGRGFEVVQRQGPWPSPVANQLLAPDFGALVLAQQRRDTIEVWRFSDGGFSSLGQAAAPLDGGTFGWDVERRGFLMLGGAPRELWFIDPAVQPIRPVLLKREAVMPTSRLGASVTGVGSKALLVGGRTSQGATGDVWSLDSVSPARLPSTVPARSRHAAWLQRRNMQPVVFGGIDTDGRALSDAWAWNGTSFVSQTYSVPEPVGEAAGVELGVAGRAWVMRPGATAFWSETALNAFVVDSMRATPAWERLNVVAGSGTTAAYFLGERDGGLATDVYRLVPAIGPTEGASEVISMLVGRDYATCLDSTGLLYAVNGELNGTELDGTWVLNVLVGGRVEVRVAADAYGDRIPLPARESKMFEMNGRCWLANNRPTIELWELDTSAAASGLVVDISVSALTAGSNRTITMSSDDRMRCWAHVDGSWRVVGTGTRCVIDERSLTPGVDRWRVAFTLEDRGGVLLRNVSPIFIETTLE